MAGETQDNLFSGEKVGAVPIEVLQQFGQLMRVMTDEVGAHLADPKGHPLNKDFRESFSYLMQTGSALVDAMSPTEERQ